MTSTFDEALKKIAMGDDDNPLDALYDAVMDIRHVKTIMGIAIKDLPFEDRYNTLFMFFLTRPLNKISTASSLAILATKAIECEKEIERNNAIG